MPSTPTSDDELTRARSLTLDGMSKEEWQKLYTYTDNVVATQKWARLPVPETFKSFQRVMTAWSKWGFEGESADKSAERVTIALEKHRVEELIEEARHLETTLTFEDLLTAAGIDLPSKFYTTETGSEEVESVPMSTGQP